MLTPFIFFTQGGRDPTAHLSRPERQRMMLLWGACTGSLMAEKTQPPCACTRPHGEGPVATLLRRSVRSSKVPQAASYPPGRVTGAAGR
jgi:hypothetical protein